MKSKKATPIFNDLNDFLKWKEEWVGMPEFIQEDLTPFKSIRVQFKDKRNRDEFSKLIDQKITNKTKSLWYPESKRENLLNKKCIDEKSKTFR